MHASLPRPVSLLLFVLLVVSLVAAGSESRSPAYRDGQRAIDEQRWDDAARAFAPLAQSAGPETDAALYWKAYADWKIQRKKEALDGLRHLVATYPDSPWNDDARALELEIRGGKPGQASMASADEELKLYALDGLMQVEPGRAVPVLERLVAGDASPRIKQRALFVLSQSDDPRAREILLRTARTGEPVELRREAVRTLGIAGDPAGLAALETIVREPVTPREVREAVVEAYLIADQSDALAALAETDPDPRVRERAIEALGAMDAAPTLRRLWSSEKDVRLKTKLLEAFGVAGDVETLARVAREAPEPELRRKAIEGLGIADDPASSAALHELYRKPADPGDRRKIIEAFMIQDDARALIALFRSEQDPEMKKVIVQTLARMDDPEATAVLLDVLGDGR